MSTLNRNLKSLLPIDWAAVTLLGWKIEELQPSPFDRRDLAVITAPNEPKEFVLMVASVIASSRNPRFSPRLPTEEDIKRLKPWIASIQGLIERVSPVWAKRFGGYVERTGKDTVNDAARLIIESAEWCRGFKEPRKQFVDQMARLYRLVIEPAWTEGFWGSRNATIEEKIEAMFIALRHGGCALLPGFNDKSFPLLFAAARKFCFPGPNFSTSEAGVAGAEFMTGIYQFLRAQGVCNLPPPPQASEFDLFDIDTWKRAAAETFYGEKLAQVRRLLPEILDLIARVLPESGPEVADAIYEIAERMCELEKDGVAPEEVCKLLFS